MNEVIGGDVIIDDVMMTLRVHLKNKMGFSVATVRFGTGSNRNQTVGVTGPD